MEITQWQREIIPAMSFFQDERGYGRACPWWCGGAQRAYDPSAYPVAREFVAAHAYLRGVYPPNGLELMERYAEACAKVFSGRSSGWSERDARAVARLRSSVEVTTSGALGFSSAIGVSPT